MKYKDIQRKKKTFNSVFLTKIFALDGEPITKILEKLLKYAISY